ncbi:Uncharacterised protein [Mycobacteroides abscessus subsp. abscessus]|nr:Uncharacterised protein [Mycobacteroides abscessus subsp. abscessus]
MCPPGKPSSRSRSSGERTSRHGLPSASSARQSANGSASTASSPASADRNAAALAASGSSRKSRAGVCSPNRVRVCIPAASPVRIDGSVSV